MNAKPTKTVVGFPGWEQYAPQWFINTAAENKVKLLAMPAGCKRPSQKESLGMALSRYISKSSEKYDSGFDKKIRKKHHQWFIDTAAAENKAKLLAMPLGCKRPSRKESLGGVLSNYISKSSKTYDSGFDKKIRKKQTHWFRRSNGD